MRVALASIVCEKGDLRTNLDRHIEVMRVARTDGCHLVVFPELSLTGSVDAARSPERAIALDHSAVTELANATGDELVAALFGIAERDGDSLFISQVYAHGGAVRGVQRKRHPAEDEVGYAAGTETSLFELGSTRFASTICAEVEHAPAWDSAAETGAQAIFLSSAPGLRGRRTSEPGWRAGFDWWDGHGLALATAHARRLSLWVGMATQAGSTTDEDFPGISALISPDGEVVDRLPSWDPGVLVVDLPLRVDADPVRWSVRVLVMDAEGRTLLAQFGDDTSGRRWWVPPGGGIEPGEDDRTTARRELAEELGRDDLTIGPAIGGRGGTFWMRDRWFTQHERWYLCRCDHFEVDPAVAEAGRAEGIRDLRWWSPGEMRAEGIVTGPRDLPDLVDRILAGDVPQSDTELGF
jgi:predicted amidohydrolase